MSQIGLKLTIWWPKRSSVIEKVKPHRARILFENWLKRVQNGLLCPIFFFYPQLWLMWSLLAANEPNWTKIDELVTKTISVIEKVKLRRARTLFWKSVKTCPKRLAPANYFYFIPNYGSSGACPQKLSQIAPKSTIWWPKQSSVIEKVKKRRARILFRNR